MILRWSWRAYSMIHWEVSLVIQFRYSVSIFLLYTQSSRFSVLVSLEIIKLATVTQLELCHLLKEKLHGKVKQFLGI